MPVPKFIQIAVIPAQGDKSAKLFGLDEKGRVFSLHDTGRRSLGWCLVSNRTLAETHCEFEHDGKALMEIRRGHEQDGGAL